MKFTSNDKKYFNSVELKLMQDGKEHTFDFTVPFRNKKEGLAKKPFNFQLQIDDQEYACEGAFGQDALWLPYGDGKGLKIIRTAGTEADSSAEQIIKNIEYIQSINSDIFPSVDWACEATIDDVSCVFTQMEEVPDTEMDFSKPYWMEQADYDYYREKLNVPVQVIKKSIGQFIEHELAPENSWYKNGGFGTRNVLNSKIVDFHLFEHKPDMYKMPSHGVDHETCQKVFDEALGRYRMWQVKNNEDLPKWKGKIYQGMYFDNGYTMPGYVSDGETFDSYVKGSFLPLDKIKMYKGKVLDIGSNNGFFDFQCALQSPEVQVTGIELTEEDILLANDIKEKILKLDNVNFINGDAIKYLEESEEWYELIIMSSVLHQTHPDLYSCDKFLETLAGKCRYFFFETPVRHKHYDFSLEEITEKLESHFHLVRLVYFYDCYSTGFRAVYICHPWDAKESGPGVYKEMRAKGRIGLNG